MESDDLVGGLVLMGGTLVDVLLELRSGYLLDRLWELVFGGGSLVGILWGLALMGEHCGVCKVMVLMTTHDMNRGKAPMLKVHVCVGAFPPLTSLQYGYVLLLLRFDSILLQTGSGLLLVVVVVEESILRICLRLWCCSGRLWIRLMVCSATPQRV